MIRQTILLTATATVALAGAAQAQERSNISIVGSSTVYPFATQVIENFSEKTDYETPVIESTGSGGGMQIFCEGVGVDTPDITNASRRMKLSEWEKCQKNGVTDITEVIVGADGVSVANSVEGPKINMKLSDFATAMRKWVVQDGEKVKNPHDTWSDVNPNLPDVEIKLYGPPPTSGTRDVMNEKMVAHDCPDMLSEEECMTVRGDDAFVEAGENDQAIVQRLQNNPNALGLFGFSFLDQNRDVIQPVSFNGVAPTFKTISNGTYPVSRTLYFYIKNDHRGTIPGIQAYVDEFLSDAAEGRNGYLTQAGLIPLSKEKREAQLKAVRRGHQLTKFDLLYY